MDSLHKRLHFHIVEPIIQECINLEMIKLSLNPMDLMEWHTQKEQEELVEAFLHQVGSRKAILERETQQKVLHGENQNRLDLLRVINKSLLNSNNNMMLNFQKHHNNIHIKSGEMKKLEWAVLQALWIQANQFNQVEKAKSLENMIRNI